MHPITLDTRVRHFYTRRTIDQTHLPWSVVGGQ